MGALRAFLSRSKEAASGPGPLGHIVLGNEALDMVRNFFLLLLLLLSRFSLRVNADGSRTRPCRPSCLPFC